MLDLQLILMMMSRSDRKTITLVAFNSQIDIIAVSFRSEVILLPAQVRFKQVVAKRCRLSWLTSSALGYEPKCGGQGAVAGSQPTSTAVHRSPNKL